MDATEASAAARDVLERYEPAAPERTAGALRSLWLSAAPPAPPSLEPGQAKLMRDWGIADPAFEAAGIPVPILSAIGQEVGHRARIRVAEWLPLIRSLWESYGREGRIVAVVALGPMELAAPEKVVPLVHDMACTCVFWEDCDQLAMRALEPVLRRDPAAWLEPFGTWVQDENKWVRRAALTAIGRLTMKHPRLTARCVELLAPALGDSDQDVKRGLSFALRVCARADVAPVKQFVRDREGLTDADSLWVMCDLIRSLARTLLPQFRDLSPIYQRYLSSAEPRARRSVEGALRLLTS